MKRKIEFLIMGAHKAGSTSLHRYLEGHPDIFMPHIEENRFFTKAEFFRNGDGYLNPFYGALESESVIGGKNVHVMYLPGALKRVRDYNPSIKLIAILRNPVKRAYSAYWFARSNGWETCETFEEALEAESGRLKGSYEEKTELTYLSHGHYAEQLERAAAIFGWRNIYVCLTSDLRDACHRTLSGIFRWLGVETNLEELDEADRHMQSAMPIVPGLQRLLMARDAWYRRAARLALPQRYRPVLQDKIVEPIRRMNMRRFRYPPMNRDTRRRLYAHFSPHNEALERLIDRDLSHWGHP